MITWNLNGEKGMSGTVELSPGYGLLWHIISPIVLDIYYGGPNAIPATYVDSQGRDQMVVIDGDGVFFDENYTGDLGESWLSLSEVIVTDMGVGNTKRITIKPVVPIQTWVINGEKGMSGTVELSPGYGLLWHIISPIVLDIYYGGPNAIPATYVDSQGRDQMVVIDGDGIFFDENYTGDLGESWLPLSDITIIDMGIGFTKRAVIKEELLCIPKWVCDPGETGYEIDGCGNRRYNPYCEQLEEPKKDILKYLLPLGIGLGLIVIIKKK